MSMSKGAIHYIFVVRGVFANMNMAHPVFISYNISIIVVHSLYQFIVVRRTMKFVIVLFALFSRTEHFVFTMATHMVDFISKGH